jgi:signal transduction histidine kinase
MVRNAVNAVNASPRQRSLRLWLQSSSLISVLAGYGLLLGVGSWITQLDRLQSHQQLVLAISRELAGSGSANPSLGLLQVLGVDVMLERPAQSFHPPRLLSRGQSLWLTSRTILRRPGQPPATLVTSQNVTVAIQRERTLLLLLIAAAGMASLFTSALLRQVLRRGLVIPIEAFCKQLQAVAQPSATAQLIPEDDQAQELQPIAAAFNERQKRLSAAWERERIFADGVAHELRTPITLISGKAQILLRQTLPPEQRQAVVAIAAEAIHMTALVRDLLELARQDGQRLQLKCRPVNPEDLMLEAFDRLRPLAPERLQLLPPEDGESTEVFVDPERLMQCISALVDNALAYSSGAVQLELRCYPHQVVWHVRDQGPGVRPEERDLIFERFARGSAASISKKRGSGLGLAVVRLLMEAMGGSVAVAAVPGGGSDFQLRRRLRDQSVRSSPLNLQESRAAD